MLRRVCLWIILLAAVLQQFCSAQDSSYDLIKNCETEEYKCWYVPDGCNTTADAQVKCQAGVAYKQISETKNELVISRLLDAQSGLRYISMGLSKDPYMSQDLVFTCITKQTTDGLGYEFRLHWNTGKTAPQTLDDTQYNAVITSTKGAIMDAWLKCTFEVLITPSIDDPKLYPLNENYNILLAWGLTKADFTLEYHYPNNRAVSTMKHNMTGFGLQPEPEPEPEPERRSARRIGEPDLLMILGLGLIFFGIASWNLMPLLDVIADAGVVL